MSSKFLPAFYFPTTAICVDDVDMAPGFYQSILGTHFKYKIYNSATSVMDFYKHYQSRLDRLILLTAVEVEVENSAIQTAVQLDLSTISDLINDRHKYDEVSLVVSDYHMTAALTGLDLCRALQEERAKKTLLTENQAYATAKDALNSNSIDYFANKTDDPEQLKAAFYELSLEFFCDATVNFKKHLEAIGSLQLSDPVFIKHFKQIVADKHIVEFYLLDRHGSYMLIDDKGVKHVLIVHNDQSLNDYAELFSEYSEYHDVVEQLKQHQLVPFFGVQKRFQNIDLAKARQYLFPATLLSGAIPYYTYLLKYSEVFS